MTVIEAHQREHIPTVYIGTFTGDDDGTALRHFSRALVAFEAHAATIPDRIAFDSADFGRFDAESLNTFLVDTGIDAVVWGNIRHAAGTLVLNAAIAPYPKVAHENRVAACFSSCLPLPVSDCTWKVAVAQVLGMALAVRAQNRPVPRQLVARYMSALESGVQQPLPPSQSANVVETLSRLKAIACPDGGMDALRRAIALNVRLSRQIANAAVDVDRNRLMRLLKQRADMLHRLGAHTESTSDVLRAIDTLGDAAAVCATDLDRARLDLPLCACKATLARLQDDPALLGDARDLLNRLIPYLYKNLAIEDWARAQTQLAGITFRLMTCAEDADSARMYGHEAISAMYEALEFYNPGNFPIAWAQATRLKDEITAELASHPARRASATRAH